MLRGVGFPGIGSELAILAVWAVVCFSIALKIFRWR